MQANTVKTDWINPSQFEQDYGVKESTQAVWRSTGRYSLPFYKIGRLVRYKRSEVETWLDSRAAGEVAK